MRNVDYVHITRQLSRVFLIVGLAMIVVAADGVHACAPDYDPQKEEALNHLFVVIGGISIGVSGLIFIISLLKRDH